MPVEYVCDICGKVKSYNLNDFRKITEEQFPSKPLELYLCVENCIKLRKIIWKLMDKIISNHPDWTYSKIEKIIEKVILELEKKKESN